MPRILDLSLATHPEWLAMLYYKPTNVRGRPNGQLSYRSQVVSSAFFLSGQGSESPEAELAATYKLLLRLDEGAPEAQRQVCRFPLRLTWLAKQLGVGSVLNIETDCPMLAEWSKEISAHSVSLIFPSSYMNNPSSMFGHTLLRIDPHPNSGSVNFLSYAINFGAITSGEVLSARYIYKGLTGGYPGRFSLLPYHKKIKDYGKIENRDIWEYELDFTQQEVERMLLHLWEVGDNDFEYYFSTQNCAFRILELLDIARPSLALATDYPGQVIPADTLRSLIDREMVLSVHYRPSTFTSLKSEMDKLNADERQLVELISQDLDFTQDQRYLSLNLNRQAKVLDAAFRFRRYQDIDQPRSRGKATQALALLSKLNSLGVTVSPTYLKLPRQPHSGHETSRISVGWDEFDSSGGGFLEFKPNYHDLLDDPDGYPFGSQIDFFSTQLRWQEGAGIELQEFDMFDIRSFAPRDSFFKHNSWRIRLGIEHHRRFDGQPYVTFFEGGGGLAHQWRSRDLFYALATGRLEYNESYQQNLSPLVGFEFGYLYYAARGALQFEASAWEVLTADDYRTNLGLNYNYNVYKNQSIRLALLRINDTHVSAWHSRMTWLVYF